MNMWPLAAHRGSPALQDTAALLPDLIDCIGRPDFGQQALECLNRVVPAASWSVYRVLSSAGPRLYSSGSRGVADRTQDCWRAYQHHHLYRDDHTVHAVRAHSALGDGVLTHWSAEEIGGRHRELIYRAHGLYERLSVVATDGDGLLAVNLYNHDSRHRFSVRETERLRAVAPMLLACVRRQLAWQAAAPAADLAAVLQALCPARTPAARAA